MQRLQRQLIEALNRGDRIAAITIAQRLWAAGDLRRTEIVGLYRTDLTSVASLQR